MCKKLTFTLISMSCIVIFGLGLSQVLAADLSELIIAEQDGLRDSTEVESNVDILSGTENRRISLTEEVLRNYQYVAIIIVLVVFLCLWGDVNHICGDVCNGLPRVMPGAIGILQKICGIFRKPRLR